ncbi:MAG TPA: CHC2 zinc finger domain-containing protein, partial [Ktedonobacterales bacterium]|nr:CHC2 zinc finger domain-containing protein [Ktedonobacterales bacterium]
RIEEIIRGRGVSLSASGERLIGRCPFHEDGSPSFTVYLTSQTYYCFGCGATGDVITFVRQIDHCGFADALQRLESSWMPVGGLSKPTISPSDDQMSVSTVAPASQSRSAIASDEGQPHEASSEDHQLTLTLATAIYHQTLLRTPAALAYLRERGISLAMARRCLLGYSDGEALRSYLATDETLARAARHCGLLTTRGQEHLAHRLIVPEIRAGRTRWMIGRVMPELGDRDRPKYLGLPGSKALLGYGTALQEIEHPRKQEHGTLHPSVRTAILVVEGALDYVVARGWRLSVPCVALAGIQAGRTQLGELAELHRRAGDVPILLGLDADAAGRAGAARLAEQFHADGVLTITLPAMDEAKDVADLATQHGGRQRYLAMLRAVMAEHAARVTTRDAVDAPHDIEPGAMP